jgi:endonuclease YncB( thermonuclease family)
MGMLTVTTYAALRKKVEETLLLGQRKIEEAKVLTYWQTGRLINAYLRKSENPNQEHGKKTVTNLARDLGFGETVFYRCMRFSEQFPTLATWPKLTWGHFRALVAVPDEQKRFVLADQAAKGEWTCRDLEIEIRNLLWDARIEKTEGKAPALLPVPALGSLWTYRILDPETISGSLLVDLGFSCCRHLEAVTGKAFRPGDIVESLKTGEGRYKLQKAGGAPDALYVYNAEIEKIVDGDTLRVVADLGFDTTTRQYVRLKGIDCPEMDTAEGKAAKKFVENVLEGLESVTLKTVKPDKYDRYLGDVFYLDKAGKQQYLNNQLIESGHAVRVRE